VTTDMPDDFKDRPILNKPIEASELITRIEQMLNN
jgi:hypothetical protein